MSLRSSWMEVGMMGCFVASWCRRNSLACLYAVGIWSAGSLSFGEVFCRCQHVRKVSIDLFGLYYRSYSKVFIVKCSKWA